MSAAASTTSRLPNPAVPDQAAAPAARVRPALREPQFVRYLVGQSVSQLGDLVWYVALSWSAVRLGSPGTASILLSLSSIPRLVLLLFGGVLADRYDIRRLMIGSDVLRCLITLAAAGIALLHPGIALLAVLALSFGIVDAVFMPSSGAMQPRLLEPEQYSGAAVISNMAARLGLAVGAPLGGLTLALGGVPLALTVDAATFAVSVAMLASVRPRPLPAKPEPRQRPTALADFRAGYRFLFHHPVLAPLNIGNILTNFGFIGPMNIGVALLSNQRGWGAAGIGTLMTGFGLGAAAGALLAGRFKIRRNVGVWIGVLGAVQGVAVFSTALAPNVLIAAITTALAGMSSGPMSVCFSVLSQHHTPDELRGRVGSFQILSSYGTVPLAMAGTGFAAALIGIQATYAVCGAVEVAGLLTLFAPAFRRARLEPDGSGQ